MRVSDVLDYLRAEKIPFTFVGDETTEVNRFSSLGNYKPGTFTWVKKQENLPDTMDDSTVTLAIVTEGVKCSFPNIVYSAESKRAFFGAIEHFYEVVRQRPAVGQFTYISPDVKLGKNVTIGHNCTLDGDITIGDNTKIGNNVVIVNRVDIGRNCMINSGSVIGHDGFSYLEAEDHSKTMVIHLGKVEIQDNVWIGSNCSIDRAEIDSTVIEEGCKIDPLVHVAHNVVLEKNCVVISGTNLMGSVHAGSNAYISSSIVRNQCKLGKNCTVGMGAVVTKNVAENTTVVGNPARIYSRGEK